MSDKDKAAAAEDAVLAKLEPQLNDGRLALYVGGLAVAQYAALAIALMAGGDEALADLIEKRRLGRPRAHVMEAYQRSHARYGELYKKLAQ